MSKGIVAAKARASKTSGKLPTIPPHNLEAYRSAISLVRLGIPVCRMYAANGDRCGCFKGTKCGTPGKHPVGGFKNHTTDPRQARKWFSGTRYNVGIPTGAVSGRVVVDIDVRSGGQASLQSLLQGGDILSLGTPIAKTGNGGFHILFEHPGDYVHTTTRAMPGVDIRADDGGIVAAGSRNDLGKPYTWLVSPETCGFSPIPESWLHIFRFKRDDQPGPKLGLVSDADQKPEESGAQRAQRAQEITESTGDFLLFLPHSSSAKSFETLLNEAIEETLPTGPGTRHDKLFEFVRRLKAIPQLAMADPVDLEEFVRQWHSRALPNIRKKHFDITLFEFIDGWNRCRWASGDNPVKEAARRARTLPIPDYAKRYDRKKIQLLLMLCAEMQKVFGFDADGAPRPFFLSCRIAAAALDVSDRNTWRWMKLFVDHGFLQLVAIGTLRDRKASSYTFHADASAKSKPTGERRLSDVVQRAIAGMQRQRVEAAEKHGSATA